jgi:uncharacterized protein
MAKLLLCISSWLLLTIGVSAQELRKETLSIRFFQVTAEIAQTPQERAKGLMGRQSLPPNHGMLFLFEEPARQCFWMRNTPLPLTIAFIDAQGKITSFADMSPFSDETHCSKVPVPYALEMEQGWFKKRGVLVGDSVSLPNFR